MVSTRQVHGRLLQETHFYIALECCACVVFGCLVAVGQTHGRHALRVLQPVLSSLFCPVAGAFCVFLRLFCASIYAPKPRWARLSRQTGCSRLCASEAQTRNRRGVTSSFAESTSRAAVLADCVCVNRWRDSPSTQSC